jgi:hypothetical protein
MFPKNYVITKIIESGMIWEYSLDSNLVKELSGKNRDERYNILKSKIDKINTLEDNSNFNNSYPFKYTPSFSEIYDFIDAQ